LFVPACFVIPDSCNRSTQLSFGVLIHVYSFSLFGFYKVDVHESVHGDKIMKVTNKMNYIDQFLFEVSPACFGRCFSPSSGALDCIYSIW